MRYPEVFLAADNEPYTRFSKFKITDQYGHPSI